MDNNAQAMSLNAAITDPTPRMEIVPYGKIELFRGLKNQETGEWETTAFVKELNGEDEEALAALESDDDLLYAQYMSHLLKRSVVSIGNIDITKNPGLVDNLIIGDRDALFLETVRATYGIFREYQIICPHCVKSNDVQIDLNDFPVRTSDKDPKEPLKATLKDGTIMQFNLVTASDSQFVGLKARSIPEQNTFLIARCAVWEEGKKPADPVAWAKKLGMKDRAKIVEALSEAQPGPEIKEVEALCAHCEQPFPIMLNWAALLFG
jgi:hypothetical protein